ncbi:MAG: ATP-binding cassette domain-containing protein [Acidimicrobiales bacterium]
MSRYRATANVVSSVWLGAVGLAALGASWLPLDPGAQDLRNGRAGPSWSHPFGTTRLGEDLLARVVHGSRVSVIVAVVATMVGLAVGSALGVAAGSLRRWVDAAVMVVVDAAAAFPALVLALALVLFRGPGLVTVTCTLALLAIPSFARVARSATVDVTQRDHVLAARASGSGAWRIMSREVLPNIAAAVGGYALIMAGVIILVEGSLSFLGLGVGTDKTSWGQLVAAGQADLDRAPQLSLLPAAVLCLTVAALAQLGEGLIRPTGTPMRTASIETPTVPIGMAPAVTDPAPLLSVRGLGTVLHHGGSTTRVLQGVTFTVAAGELLGVLGESGSGKSTLARSLVGLAPFGVDARFEGDVCLDGVDLILRGQPTAAAREQRGHGIAHVTQDPATSLDPVMRIGPQVAELIRRHCRHATRDRPRSPNDASQNRPDRPERPNRQERPDRLDRPNHQERPDRLDRRGAAARAIELLAAVGLPDPERCARCFPHQLSGGLRQRVTVAMALAADPVLLVADEPTSALDVTTGAALLDLLDRLRHQRGLTVLLISHDLRLLAERADRVAVLHQGRLVEIGPADQVLNHPTAAYTASLVAAAGSWPPPGPAPR